MTVVAYERKINLPKEKLYSLLADFSKSPTPDFKVELLEKGDPDAGGPGATRLITIGKDTTKQVLVETNQNQGYAYRIIDHPLIKDYYAMVVLTEEGSSTLLSYQAEVKPAIFFTGGIICSKVKATLLTYFDSIDKHYCQAG